MTGGTSGSSVGLARCGSGPAAGRVLRLAIPFLLALAGGKSAGEEARVLEVGYSSELLAAVDPDDARAATAVWISRVVARTNIEASTVVRTFADTPAMLRSLKAREVDLLLLSPLQYLEVKASPLLRPGFIPSLDGQVGQRYALLVRNDYAGAEVDGLRGRAVLVHRSIQGGVARLWLDTYLLRRSLPQSSGFFGSLGYVQRPSEAVLAVLFGQADAGLVTVHAYETMCELNPQLRRDLRVLESSPRFALGPICLRQEVYEEFCAVFDETLLSLHTDPEGRQILALFGVTEVVPFKPEYLWSLVNLVDEHERLRLTAGSLGSPRSEKGPGAR